jgi:YHS domain-containing protein
MTLPNLRLLVVATVTTAALAACQPSPPASSPPDQAAPHATPVPAAAPSSSTPAPPPAAALTRVADPSLVCMVNDQFMGKPQIPTEVGGKTYFGCCAMCKEKLEQQLAARTSTDPVTGEQVDKATAVIAQKPDGRVLYFASETNLKTYASKL